MIRRILVVALAALLAGCAQGRKADTDFSADKAASGDNAAIIIGLGATKQFTPRPGLAPRKGLAAPVQTFWLNFVAYEPNGDVLRHLNPVVSVTRRACLIDQSPDCDLGRITRHVLAVPAGDYAIAVMGTTAFQIGGRQQYHYVTRFVRQLPSPQQPTVPSNDAELTRWRIAPGEVIYLGDFVYNPYVFPASLQQLGRNDTAALQALEAYPNLRGRMAFRLPILGRQSQATDLNAVRERFESKAFEAKE